VDWSPADEYARNYIDQTYPSRFPPCLAGLSISDLQTKPKYFSRIKQSNAKEKNKNKTKACWHPWTHINGPPLLTRKRKKKEKKKKEKKQPCSKDKGTIQRKYLWDLLYTMETAEPVSSYDFPGHVGAYAHRRMDSSLFPYYSHPTSAPSYSLPYHAPTAGPYHFAPLSQPSHPYGHYFMASQPPLTSPVRLNQPQPLHALPEIRPAKNAINQSKGTDPQIAGSATIKKEGFNTEFSTEVDVLMKAIQAKPESSPSPIQQSLPPLQHLAPGYSSYPMTPPRCLMTSEGQLSRSGKKLKYTCNLPGCGKSFAQKTHLDIHMRAHTGDKPFVSTDITTDWNETDANEETDLQGTRLRTAILTTWQFKGKPSTLYSVPLAYTNIERILMTLNTTRPTSVVTREKSHTLVISATKDSRSGAMCGPTRLPISRTSPLPVYWMIAGKNSLSWAISRYSPIRYIHSDRSRTSVTFRVDNWLVSPSIVPPEQVPRLNHSFVDPTILPKPRPYLREPPGSRTMGVFCDPVQEQQQGDQRSGQRSTDPHDQAGRHGQSASHAIDGIRGRPSSDPPQQLRR